MSGCGCGGSNPCNNMLLKYFGFDCSTGAAGKYVVNVTKDTCGNCNAYFVPETAASAFDCNNVTTCINTNAGTQTAINNLINSRLNFPSGTGDYILTIGAGGVVTRTPYAAAGGSNVPNKPVAPGVYELTIDGSGNATWTLATSGGTWTCADTENCIRTNAGVQDAIRDLIFGNGNTTLCAAITAAGCSVGTSSFPFSSAKSTSFNFSGSGTSNGNTSQVQNVTSASPIAGLHIKGHIGANNNDGSSVGYAGGNVDLYYDATTNILYGTATSMYGGVTPYAAGSEYAVGGVSNAISFNGGSYVFNTYVESSISVTENTPSDFNVNFGAYHYGGADGYSFTGIIQVY